MNAMQLQPQFRMSFSGAARQKIGIFHLKRRATKLAVLKLKLWPTDIIVTKDMLGCIR